MKPNLWLLVNPNIACPIQYRERAADVQALSEPAEEVQTPLLDPAETHDAPLQEQQLRSVSSSTEYMVQYSLRTSAITLVLLDVCAWWRVLVSTHTFTAHTVQPVFKVELQTSSREMKVAFQIFGWILFLKKQNCKEDIYIRLRSNPSADLV